MNRNLESNFAQLPNVDIGRSILAMDHGHQTAFNVGDLVCHFWSEVLPGDTWKMTTSVVARLQTLLAPIFGNIYIDTFYFFVPMRLTWIHTKEFFGENTSGPWAQTTTYTIPKIASPTNGWNKNTIADYMGIPPGVEFNSTNGLMPSALPIRAYAECCDVWFRDQNLTDPLNIPKTDSTQTGSNGSSYINDVANGGAPFKVAKYHDYFTSCLPDPQKSRQAVTFPLISGSRAPLVGQAPVYFGTEAHTHSNAAPMIQAQGFTQDKTKFYNLQAGTINNQWPQYLMAEGNGTTTPAQGTMTIPNGYADLTTSGIYANLSSTVGSVTINQLRLSFQMQRFYEKAARAGSRYHETIKEMFGCTVPDARVQIPEYLGGHRFPLSIHQITNNAASSGQYLGDVGAMSNTADIHDDFVKSFTEHGFIIGVCCARYDHSYPQGLNRSWTRSSYFDYYWPVFANIGEQPVYKYEIDATVRSGENRLDVFGYQEAWASYRYMPNRCSSSMRPQVSGSLASWNLSDNYATMPSLSDGWIREDKAPVDRTLAVTSSQAEQVFADFWFDATVTRAMPVFSIPGLIDHH